ncbi:MAG TPA: hypothetical protein VGP72_20125 [Planctomycetota bacterium]|jgi:hypothetical protein
MTQPRPGQIWFLDEPRLGDSEHGHYVLVTQVLAAGAKVNINFIATDPTANDDFRIADDADGFAATGLKHTCHLLRDRTYDIRTEQLAKGRYAGVLTGELQAQIEEWWGEAFA